MKILAGIVLVIFTVLNVSSQALNMSLCCSYDNDSLPFRGPVAYNDVWGYVAKSGVEVGIFGSVDSIYFLEIMPDCIQGLRRINVFKGGSSSIWRDFKTYRHYAYAVADEGAEGLMVFDLSYIPDSVHLIGRDDSVFQTAHNLYIDTLNGHLFLAGAQSNGLGIDLIMYDINTNPAAPKLIKKISLPGGYVHDVHVVNDTAFCSHGYNGMYIYAIDPNGSFQYISSMTIYPQQGYNHSSWVSHDRKTLIFADETHNTSLKLVDIANVQVPRLKSLFRSALLAPLDTMSIVHNPFIKGDLVFLSYYHDGIQVFNISNPLQPIQIAYYDTEPNNTDYTGFQGAWGTYPYLPSGKILATDIRNGFFVLQLDITLDLELITLYFNDRTDEKKLEWTILPATGFQSAELQISEDAKKWLKYKKLNTVLESGSLKISSPSDFSKYFRLKCIDLAGQDHFSNIVQKPRDTFGDQYAFEIRNNRIFPNSKEIKILKITIFNINGSLVESFIPSSSYPSIPDGLLPGVYCIELELMDELIPYRLKYVK